MTKWHNQDNYRANQQRLGLVQVTTWLPQSHVSAFQRAADRIRLSYFESTIAEGDITKLEAMASRNSLNIDQAEGFDTFVCETADLVEGGDRHKDAVKLFNRYRKLIQDIHLQRGAVASSLAIGDSRAVEEKAKLTALSQQMRVLLNERDWLVDGGPVISV